MTRDEKALEIIAANLPHPDPIGMSKATADYVVRHEAERIVRALVAAGVIPAEGTVTIPKAEHDFLLEFAREHSTTSGPSAYESYEAAAGRLLGEHLFGSSGDLDAIPAAPTGEETP